MSELTPLEGLTCPKCGGVLSIAEGQTIVRCPYCDMRSLVRGERGLRRFQVACQVNRAQAIAALSAFLSGHFAIARDARRQAQRVDASLAHVPFWMVDARGIGYAFGQKKVGKNNYESRELTVAQEINWNGPACDLNQFGLERVPMTLPQLQPYAESALHASGMVFEPMGALNEAQKAAQSHFEHELHKATGGQIDHVTQEYTRLIRQRYRLVYYPLWLLRYVYHGRAFQVVIDGVTSNVLYGKAPGSIAYRAAVLVLGMASGALLLVAAPAWLLSSSSADSDAGCLPFIVALIGLAIMLAAYRTYRHGEQYELKMSASRSSSAMRVDDLQSISDWVSSQLRRALPISIDRRGEG